MKCKHFCGKCGKQNMKTLPANFSNYKFMEKCQSCGHEVFIGGLGNCDECDSGLIPVRTTSNVGFQTVHVGDDEIAKKFKDSNYFSLCIAEGVNNLTK